MSQLLFNRPICGGVFSVGQHPAHQFRVGGDEEAQWKMDGQHPRSDRRDQQYLVHQQGGAFYHAVGAATAAEAYGFIGGGRAASGLGLVFGFFAETLDFTSRADLAFDYDFGVQVKIVSPGNPDTRTRRCFNFATPGAERHQVFQRL